MGYPSGWIVRLAVDAGTSELVMSLLWDAGTTGVADLDGLLVAGFEDRAGAERAVATANADRWPTTVVSVEPVSWSGGDETSIVAVPAGDSGRGRRAGAERADRVTELTIVAGPTFGHGGHPTTALALELLVSEIDTRRRSRASGRPAPDDGPSVLDVGTGSGVLAIAAAAVGARPVVGIDIDPAAPAVARANAAANGVVAAFSTDPVAEAVAANGGPFEVVVANLLVATQRELAPALAGAVWPDGALITAGYLADDDEVLVEVVTGSIERAGRGPIVAVERRERSGWLAHRFALGR